MRASGAARTRSILLAGFLAVLVAGATTCGRGEPATVQVVGDSLTRQANGNGGLETRGTDLLDALGEAGFTAAGGGVDGLRVDEAYRTVWSPEPRSDILVIALGTNDMRDGRLPVAAVRSTLTAWLDRIPDTCVVFVEVDEGTDAWQLDVYGPAYNAMLREVAEEHGDGHTVAWNPQPGMLAEDGIHLTDLGSVAYRQLVVEGAERC